MDEAPWVTAALQGSEGQKWHQSHGYAAAALEPPHQGPSSKDLREIPLGRREVNPAERKAWMGEEQGGRQGGWAERRGARNE